MQPRITSELRVYLDGPGLESLVKIEKGQGKEKKASLNLGSV
jgi:hypothetical protein